jgi:drug/metabolite transporter (DMT)-like permease
MTKPENTSTQKGYPIALLSAAILSTSAIFVRYLTQYYRLPPIILSFWRDLFVAIVLLIILALIRPGLLHVTRSHLYYLFIYGFVLAIFNSVWTLSVSLNGAAVGTVLAYCSAAFTALLGWWFLKESLTWVKGVAVLLCMGGCVLVAGALDPAAWSVNLIGIITGIGSGLFYAIYTLMGRSASNRGLNPWTTLLYTFGFGAIWLLEIDLVGNGSLPGTAKGLNGLLWLGADWQGWLILFILAAIPTVAGFGLYNVSLSLMPSSVVNLIVTTEPAFTALWAYFLLSERFTAVQVMGSVLIVSGVVFLRLWENKSLTAKDTKES